MNNPQPTPAPVQPEGTQSPTTIVLFGALGFLFGPLGGIGWYYGKQYQDACADEGLTPDPNAVTGTILGMVSFLLFCVFTGIAAVMVVLWLVMFIGMFAVYFLIIVIALIASV